MKQHYKPYYNEVKRLMLHCAETDERVYRTELGGKPSIKMTKQAIAECATLVVDNDDWRLQHDNYETFDEVLSFHKSSAQPTDEHYAPIEADNETKELKEFVHKTSKSLKPKQLYVDDLKWKYAVRSVMRAQNMMVVGPTGAGKTMMVKWIAQALDRPLHIFNLGSTQDPRATLIGNTHFDTDKGTFFSQSAFVHAIQQPNAIILLDELSRANPEAFNILMTALDPHQRTLRLDETVDSKVINIEPTVTFIATANIGHEYTSTRVIDRALQDRFVTIEMDYLDYEGEMHVLSSMFPMLDQTTKANIAGVATKIRDAVNDEDSPIERSLSTRHTLEMASLMVDGFSFSNVLDIVVYPSYSHDGGLESERTYVKQLIQSTVGETADSPF